MRNTAFVLGLVGSILALLIGLIGFVFGGAVGARGYAVVAILVPIVALIGASSVKAKPGLGGALMWLAVIVSVGVFGLHLVSAVPAIFLALAGSFALASRKSAGSTSN